MLINQFQTHFSAGELAPTLEGRVDIRSYASSCASIINYVVTAYGNLTHRPGFRFVRELYSSAAKGRLVAFEYSNTDTYILEFTNTKIRFYKNKGIILSGMTPYEVTTPYLTADLDDLRFTQSYDTLYITHGSYEPRKLVRFSDASWSLSTIAFDEPAWLDVNTSTTTLTFSAVSGSGVTCTASAATFASTDVGRSIRFRAGVENTEATVYTGTGSQTNFDIPFFPNAYTDIQVFKIDATGARTEQTYDATPVAGEFNVSNGQVILGGTAISTSEKVLIQRKNAGSGIWGWATITAYTSSTVVTVTVNSLLGGTNASTDWRLGAWSATTGYPRVVTFYEQRLWFANTSTLPNGLWGSATGDFENFAPDNDDKKGQIDSDTSVFFKINTVTINWIRGLKALLVGCGDGVFQITGGGGAITAGSVLTRKDSSLQTEFAETSATAEEVLFVERLGKKIYSIRYSFEANGFVTNDLNVLAPHISGTSKFKVAVYAEIPNKTVWAIRNDGAIKSCTYLSGAANIGWASHTIGGTNVEVESIAVISGSTYSEVWAIIKRTINGNTKRYVEVMEAYFDQANVTTSFFVDSGLAYSGSATTTLTGLDHLEGETVTVIANGATHPPKVVSSGQITTEISVTSATVGLYATASFETSKIYTNTKLGEYLGQIGAIHTAIVKFHETVGGRIGYDSSSLSEIYFRTGEDNMNQALATYSGDKRISFPHGFDRGIKVYIEQPYALPSTILMLTYQANISQR